jgi:hypothetical protein|tara:strand:- start:4774 stop:5133 length:360 start_codon:yes stop_codon:yes gene_type:complete
MSITQDGTQAFGIDASPITINAVTYVAEGMSFNYSGSRVDINDSNGEPLGQTIIPGRLEGSATVQMALGTTASDLRGLTFTLTSTNGSSDGEYYIVDSSEAQSQGDYVKVSINFVKKLN